MGLLSCGLDVIGSLVYQGVRLGVGPLSLRYTAGEAACLAGLGVLLRRLVSQVVCSGNPSL